MKEKEKTGGEINFNQLHNAILGVHIDDRCKYLSKFKRLFLKYDPENKGIIDKDQCIQLLSTLYNNLKTNKDFKYKSMKNNEFVSKFYNDIDKNKTDIITFNQIVTYLTDSNHNLMNLISRV